MQKSIDLILREIDRSDNEKMRYKSGIMKAFINSRFFDLDPEEDIVKEYEQYEKKIMENDVTEFAESNGITPDLVLSILNKYFVDERSITKNKIRERLADILDLKPTKTKEVMIVFQRCQRPVHYSYENLGKVTSRFYRFINANGVESHFHKNHIKLRSTPVKIQVPFAAPSQRTLKWRKCAV